MLPGDRIAIDEYKDDTNASMYQLIIANAEKHEPLDNFTAASERNV